MGDRTPKLHGRSGWSIKSFADPVGTYVLPAIFVAIGLFSPGNLGYYPPFGWGARHALGSYPLSQKGKPIAIALAGPLVTGLVAVVAGAAARSLSPFSDSALLLGGLAFTAASLTIIELIPIPGRDGGRVLQRFLSPRAAMKMEEFAEYHVLFLLGLYLLLGFLLRDIVGAGCRALRAC
jgi:Zn-dependent protease